VVRTWRERSGRSQGSFAVALGTSQQHLSLIEKGLRPLTIALRRRLVKDLGIPAEELGLSSRPPPVDYNDVPEAVTVSRLRWRTERRWLNTHRDGLAKLAVGLYPMDWVVPRSPVIAHPSWRLDSPVDLGQLHLRLDEERHPVEVDGSESETEPVRPLRTLDDRFDRYSSAVRYLDSPALFESRPSYRLLSGTLATGVLDFGLATYFDKLDISEALGHELAGICEALGGVPRSVESLLGRLRFRDRIGDPFDPRLRAILPAITTLTIRLRRYPAEPSFLLHWRDPAKVATAAGVYDVIPAGEFQPSSVAPWDRRSDFDLWRNIVREYSEELLGMPEHDGTRSWPIDYDGWPLFRQLHSARRDGTAQAWLLGMGLDALTLAATILTVVVVDDDVFARAFGSSVRFNDEGEIVGVAGGRPADGIPFTEVAVRRILEVEPMASPGAACLSLAWQHRNQLLGL
jgi:transcriptional regulator with XRE-family HTH domain